MLVKELCDIELTTREQNTCGTEKQQHPPQELTSCEAARNSVQLVKNSHMQFVLIVPWILLGLFCKWRNP